MPSIRITAQEVLHSLVNEGLILVGDHSHVTTVRDIIKFKCEAFEKGTNKENCQKTMVKRLRVLKEYKYFSCDECKIRRKYKNDYDKLRRISIFNKLKIDFNLYLDIKRDDNIDFPCINPECINIVSKTLRVMEKTEIFHCRECYLKINGFISYDIKTLNELFTKNNVTSEKDYKDEFLTVNYILGFYCKKCNILVKKSYRLLYEHNIFYCQSCSYENDNMIRMDRKFLNKFIKNEDLELAEDPGNIIDRNKHIKIYCKTKECREIIIKKFTILFDNKNFNCHFCQSRIAEIYDDKIYYDFICNYQIITITTQKYLTANKIIIGKCKAENCSNLFFDIFHNLYKNKLPYCISCSQKIKCNRKNKDKYSISVVDSIFLEDEDYTYNKDKEFNIDTELYFNCINKICNSKCIRSVQCLIEGKNKLCNSCTLSQLDKVEYDDLFSNIISVLYPGIIFEKIESNLKVENILYKYSCSNETCSNFLIKSFIDLVERQEIYCGCYTESTYDKSLRLLTGKFSLILNKKYKNLLGADEITGNCTSEKCQNNFCKTIESLTINELPFCEECTNKIIQQRAKESFINKYGVEYSMQVPEFLSKAKRTAFGRKEYKLPDSEIIFLRGYEPQMMDILLYQQEYKQEQLITEEDKVPEIWYKMDDKDHRYYTDIYIPDEKRCIEVKSGYIFVKDYYQNYLKHRATILAEYSHEVYILNKKGDILEIIREIDPSLEHEYRNKYHCFVNIRQELEDESEIDSDFDNDTEDEQENEEEEYLELDEEFKLEKPEEEQYEDDWISEDEPIYSSSDED